MVCSRMVSGPTLLMSWYSSLARMSMGLCWYMVSSNLPNLMTFTASLSRLVRRNSAYKS